MRAFRARFRAWCFASGHIGFGHAPPQGALVFAVVLAPAAGAGGDAEASLREFVGGVARHGYDTETIDGRRVRKGGTDCLLVPGVPEAPDEVAALAALERWCDRIKPQAPRGVVVL